MGRPLPSLSIALLRRRFGGGGGGEGGQRRSLHIVEEGEAARVSHRRIEGKKHGDVPPRPEHVCVVLGGDHRSAAAAAVNGDDGGRTGGQGDDVCIDSFPSFQIEKSDYFSNKAPTPLPSLSICCCFITCYPVIRR